MSDDSYIIKRSDNGAYYSMYHNDIFIGNYDTVYEAAQDLEEIRQEEGNAEGQARIESLIMAANR